MKCWTRATIALSLTMGPLASAHAASPDHCAPTVQMDPLQLLRQISLDLRGHGPTYEEYEWVRGADEPHEVVEDLVDEMLESDAHFDEVRRYHRALMWGSLDAQIIPSPFASQRVLTRNNQQNWRLRNMRRRYRGERVDCLNEEQPPEEYANGRPLPLETRVDGSCLGGTCQREGYVWVDPYWDPGNPIKVCAFDAQELQQGNNGAECSVYHSNDTGCGCGPGLTWCGPNSVGADIPIREALAEEPARIFEWVVREHRSYLEAFTTRRPS